MPPTTTPEPTATATPMARVYENVAYNDMGLDYRKQTVSVYLPESGDGPFPVIHLKGGFGCLLRHYSDFIDELNARGYGVVVFEGWTGQSSITPGGAYTCLSCDDLLCSWAWLQAQGAEYGLATDRAIALGHYYGMQVPLLGVADEALWSRALAGCPHPQPEPGTVKGIAVYDGFYGLPEADLADWPSGYAAHFNVSRAEFLPVLDELVDTPPEAWSNEEALSEGAHAIAPYLPVKYLADPESAAAAPPFLLMHGDPGVDDDVVYTPPMAARLEAAGIPHDVWQLEDGDFGSITWSDHGVTVAERVDAFAREVFAAGE